MAKELSSVHFAPLRNLNDFLLESARFQIPTFGDPDKWANRVINNLLYYQTNYLLSSIIVFLIVSLIHPVRMAVGVITMLALFGVFLYMTRDRVPAEKFKKEHPLLCVLIILTSCSLLLYTLGSILVFLLGILLPLLLTFIHASMRLRNIKNKITNKLEQAGLQRTPMGIFLDALGQEQEMWS